jgi:hypothetical protein
MSGRPTITPSASVTMVSLCSRMVALVGATTLILRAFLLRSFFVSSSLPLWPDELDRCWAPALAGAQHNQVLEGGDVAAVVRGTRQTDRSGLADRHLHHWFPLFSVGGEWVTPAGLPAIGGAAAPPLGVNIWKHCVMVWRVDGVVVKP